MEQESYSNYLDFYRRSPYAPHLVEHRLAGSSPVRVLTISQPAGHFPDPPTADLTIQLITGADNSPSEIDVGAGRAQFRSQAGLIALQPADASGDFLLSGPHNLLITAIPGDAIKRLLKTASPGFEDFGRLHAAPFGDPFVEALCHRLWAEAAEGSALGSLFADYAIQTLALTLLRLSHQPVPALALAKGGLAPRRLARVLERMRDCLAEDVSLDELADAAGLHPVYFVRVFKAETGTTPHRYLLERRVEHAKTLLATTAQPIAEVALACGFASQSHLSTWFRRLTGTSPKRWRDHNQS